MAATVWTVGTTLNVQSPYSDGFRWWARENGGRWQPADRIWQFPSSAETQVKRAVAQFYPAPARPAQSSAPASTRPVSTEVTECLECGHQMGGYRTRCSRCGETEMLVHRDR
jgi:hypothetical protein